MAERMIPQVLRAILEAAGEFSSDGAIYRIRNPFTGRPVVIPSGDLPRIADLIPENVAKGDASPRFFVEALLAARINLRTLSLFRETENGFSLAPTAQDPFSGYYYPEKGEGMYFKAHGRITVVPDLIRPVARPEGSVLETLALACEVYAKEPFTALTAIGHGVFTFIAQAKRLNGQKRIFARLVEIGRRPVAMTHWARLGGLDSTALIKRSGIDVRRLAPRSQPSMASSTRSSLSDQ